MTAAAYRLVPPRLGPAPVPVLDPSQQAVVDHPGGPLLVLAGPGTGKTTTLVEAVAARVERGLSPEQVLVLTFSRKAADELRERIALRVGRTLSEPAAYTFHAFCSALVGAYGDGVPRLLSGPERLVRIRDLLAGDAAGEGSTRWPPALRPCLLTRGFAQEVADLLDRLRERALTAGDLRSMARREGRDDWRAAADFFDEYIEVLRGRETDYAELVAEALRLLETDLTVLADVRDRYRAVFVDEYQDTDPAQERLLALLAGDGRNLVVVGDPDQSIYRFRGADVSCLLEFPDRFRAGGRPAPVLSLALSRRAGAELLAVSRSVARGLPAPGLAAERLRAHRELAPAPALPVGECVVGIYGTEADEAIAIADLLRRAHLGRLPGGVSGPLPWSEMAVLVRSGVRSIPVLHRALVGAGVPVVVAADEVPLARDPAVAPLLLALRAAADAAELTPARVTELLTSALVGTGPAQLRRLGRLLRARDRDAAAPGPDGKAPPSYPRPSAELIAEATREPHRLVGLPAGAADGARRLVGLLDAARAALPQAELALWAVWEDSGWPGRLTRASRAGGQEGRSADRDLDAVVALFDTVGRYEQSRPQGGVAVLLAELEAQEIPSASRVEGPLGDGGVRLLTAHRAKGLEWDLVVVAGVQDGTWPDVRRRGSLLAADRVGRDGVEPPASPATLVADERRLFYVAITRARRHLMVTAVQSVDDSGPRPSRFLEELGVDLPAPASGSRELLSAGSLAGRLRRVAVDPATSDGLRAAAAGVLARLAAPLAGTDQPAVPAADPQRWWGMSAATPGELPVRPATEPVRLSGSALAAFSRCPLRWFLEREARAAQSASTAQGFGQVVHALARVLSTADEPPTGADIEALLADIDSVWEALRLEAAWHGDQQRDKARAALGRLATWLAANDRRHLGSEVQLREVEVAGALLTGRVDRLDVDAEGRLQVVDYKTSGSKPTRTGVVADLQLGFYQLAGQSGAFADTEGAGRPMGGAELVQLVAGLSGGKPTVMPQGPIADDGGDVRTALDAMVASIRSETFPARPNDRCPMCEFRQACPAQDAGRQVVT